MQDLVILLRSQIVVEEVDRIDLDVILQHLIMQVDACSLARAADKTDELATFYLLSLADSRFLEMCITCLVAETVVNGNHVAVTPFIALYV